MRKINSKKTILATGIYALFLIVFATSQISAQQLAFPDAEGFGQYTTGGRYGEVYHVTNLDDDGDGSFRDAVSESNRIVVFDVGGVINITDRIVINSNITVAGQTAPGGGITIYGNGIAFNGNSGNDIIRYIRIRMGVNGDYGKDAISISDGTDYIFDHVSISWGRDGTLDVNGDDIDNMTFQDCIISQGINNLNHSTGGLMQSGQWSMIRSLYIDNKTRNPKARGTHEFINSVLYNWGTNGYIMGNTSGTSECNMMGNYFIYGPSSSSDTHFTGSTSTFYVYAEDNWVDADTDGTLDGTLISDYGSATVMSSAYDYPGVNNLMSAQDALAYVIDNVGSSLVRDEVDELLISQVESYGTSGSIIDRESDNDIDDNVGTVDSGTSPTDTDQDGMPDDWEEDNNLDPSTADDADDADGDGYTNIEEYLEWIIDNHDALEFETVATLTKHGSGSSIQSITFGDAISDFYYSWTYATSVNVSGMPSGITTTIDTDEKTVSFTGTPTETGTFSFTVTTVGADENTSKSGTITVTSSSTDEATTIEENETGFCNVDGSVDNDNDGYSGDGFANTDNEEEAGIDWAINGDAGTYTFVWNYANGGSTDRSGVLYVNEYVVATVSFTATDDWETWTTASISVDLESGYKTIRLEADQSSGLANIDYMTVTGPSVVAADCDEESISSSSLILNEDELNDEENNDVSKNIRVYPNPVEDILYIKGQGIISIYNAIGVKVFEKENAAEILKVDVSGYSAGVYLIVVNNNQQLYKQKIIKQ